MASPRAAKATRADAARDLPRVDLTGEQIGPDANQPVRFLQGRGLAADCDKAGTQATIRAELIGSDQCTAGEITACGPAPILKLCRKLIAAGVDPDTRLVVYRGALACIIVNSIGEAAGLTVDEHNGPYFARWKPFISSAGSPPVRQNGKPATTTAEAHE
jgi:hypothetical protein